LRISYPLGGINYRPGIGIGIGWHETTTFTEVPTTYPTFRPRPSSPRPLTSGILGGTNYRQTGDGMA